MSASRRVVIQWLVGSKGILTIPDAVTEIGQSAFSNCGFTGSLTIPNSVTVIGTQAFSGCRGFTGSLTIGDAVTEIGGEAFYGCTGFTTVVALPAVPPRLGDLPRNVVYIKVPAGSVAAYKAANNWSAHSAIIKVLP